MKRLVFKKWMEYTNLTIGGIGLFMLLAFEWPTFTPYIIGLLMFMVSGILEGIYGRN